MPAYNTAKYIGMAIESIQAQEYKNWQLVIVDDASTDETAQVAQQYADDDERICFHRLTSNMGVSNARNCGLDCSNGEIICFLDSDDYVQQGYLNNRLKALLETNSDMVVSGFKCVSADGSTIKSVKPPYATLGQHKGYISPIELGLELYLHSHMIVSDIAKQVRFDTRLSLSEDRDYLYKIYSLCRTIMVVDDTTYLYRQRSNSLTHDIDTDNLINSVEAEKRIYESEMTREDSVASYTRYVNQILGALRYIYKTNSHSECIEMLEKELLKLSAREEALTGFVKIKYIIYKYCKPLYRILARIR